MQTIDREILKEVVLELLTERHDLLKAVVKEVLEENNIIVSDEQAERRQKIQAFIQADFDKYNDVFKALA